MAHPVLASLKEELEEEIGLVRELLEERGWHPSRITLRDVTQWLRRTVSGFGWLAPRTRAQWTAVLLNWALLLLIVLLWESRRLGEWAPILVWGTVATLALLYAYFYDVAWWRPVTLDRSAQPPYMPIRKRTWLGRAVRLRYRMDILWMFIKNEFTGEIQVLGPYCPQCRPRQKLGPKENLGLLGLTWFGVWVSYEWRCPGCRKKFRRPKGDEEAIAEEMKRRFEKEW